MIDWYNIVPHYFNRRNYYKKFVREIIEDKPLSDLKELESKRESLKFLFEHCLKLVEYDEKKAKFMEIPNIEIENVGNESYKKLFFVRDESSSEDFIFIENNKNINFHQLSLNGEFSPDSKESHQVNLRINNPSLFL